jgi:hypothetical protein
VLPAGFGGDLSRHFLHGGHGGEKAIASLLDRHTESNFNRLGKRLAVDEIVNQAAKPTLAVRR